MGFRRAAGVLLAAALLAAGLGAYAPATVEAWSPAAGVYARKLHELLPGADAPPAVAAAGPTAPAPPPPRVARVVVGRATRKDLPWRIE